MNVYENGACFSLIQSSTWYWLMWFLCMHLWKLYQSECW